MEIAIVLMFSLSLMMFVVIKEDNVDCVKILMPLLIIFAFISAFVGSTYVVPDYIEKIERINLINESQEYLIEVDGDVFLNCENDKVEFKNCKIVLETNSTPYLLKKTYTWDDNKFPYNIFFTEPKRNINELHLNNIR